MKPSYGLDLDGVVYDLVNPFDIFMKEKGSPLIDKGTYNIGKRYGIPEQEGWNHLREFIEKEEGFLHIPMYQEAYKAVEYLNEEGNLYIITARARPHAKNQTLERLKQDFPFLVPEQIIITKEKGNAAQKLNITTFFEDLIPNALNIIQKSSSIIKLINQDYNQEKIFNPKITRHPSLYEAVFGN